MASSVAAAIEPKLRQSEIDRAERKPTGSLNAYDLYLRALAQFNRWSEEGFAEAVALARQALASDPIYALAAAMIGWCRSAQRFQGWGALSEADMAEAIRLARQALEMARDDTETLWRAGYTLFLLAGEVPVAEAMLDRAVTLNPNAAMAWVVKGNLLTLRNRPDAAIEALDRARRLNPFDPIDYLSTISIALTHIAAKRFEEAIEWADRALHDQPRLITAMRVKTAAYAHLGRLGEARAELKRVLAIDPRLTIARYRAALAPALAPEVFELFAVGLRRAGLPEN